MTDHNAPGPQDATDNNSAGETSFEREQTPFDQVLTEQKIVDQGPPQIERKQRARKNARRTLQLNEPGCKGALKRPREDDDENHHPQGSPSCKKPMSLQV